MIINPYRYAPSERVNDTFTDTSSTALASHTPDFDYEGGGWDDVLGGHEISSNQATATGTPGGLGNIAVIDSGLSDCVIEATYKRTVNPGARSAGIIARYATNNFWFMEVLFNVTASMSIYEYASGWTQRATSAITANVNTVYPMKVTLNGTTITFRFNDTTEISYNSATTSETETKHGLRTNTTDVFFDDLTVNEL